MTGDGKINGRNFEKNYIHFQIRNVYYLVLQNVTNKLDARRRVRTLFSPYFNARRCLPGRHSNSGVKSQGYLILRL